MLITNMAEKEVFNKTKKKLNYIETKLKEMKINPNRQEKNKIIIKTELNLKI